MAFIFIDPARRKKRKVHKSAESQAVLDALDKYLEGNIEEPVKWLTGFWKDQAAAFTYKELLSLVTDEAEPEQLFNTWFQDYSKLLSSRIIPMWESAFVEGAKSNPRIANLGFEVNTADTRVREWILDRGGELVTNVTGDQVNAIRYILAESRAENMGTGETARYIRPTVGLTERQAEANLKHYNAIKEQLRTEHPRMKDETIERKARESAGRFAAQQQRTRAETIARTELATAYNTGNDEAVRQAVNQGLMPIVHKVWSTAMDGHVCSACEDLEGTEVGMDDEFSATIGKNVKRTLSTLLPPMHPRCKCAVMYVETGEYITQSESEGALGIGNSEEEPDTYYEILDRVEYENAEEEIDKWNEQFRYELVENAVVVDKNGDVHHFVGDERRVGIFGVDLDGAYVTHNHPESEGIVSFGADDFYFLREHQGIACLQCVNPEYTYRINGVLKPMDNLVYNDLYREAMMDVDSFDEDIDLQDKVMQILSKGGYIRYEKIRFK